MPLHSFFGTVIRTAPDGRKTRFEVTRHQEAEYLKSLEELGYTYQTITVSNNSCVSCEG